MTDAHNPAPSPAGPFIPPPLVPVPAHRAEPVFSPTFAPAVVDRELDVSAEHYHEEVLDRSEDDIAAPASARKAKRGAVDRAAVRRIASKYEELGNATPEHVELLSTALGIPNDPIELTVAVMTGSRAGLAGLTDTLSLAENPNPYEAMVTAISFGRARIKAVWAVLAEIGAVTGSAPAADVKAGGLIAKAAAELEDVNKNEIRAVLALAKK